MGEWNNALSWNIFENFKMGQKFFGKLIDIYSWGFSNKALLDRIFFCKTIELS